MRVWSALIVGGGLLLAGCAGDLYGYPGGGVYAGSSYGYSGVPYGYGGYGYGYEPGYAAPYAYSPAFVQPYAYAPGWRHDNGWHGHDNHGSYHGGHDRVSMPAPAPHPHAPPPAAHSPSTREFMGNMGFTPNH